MKTSDTKLLCRLIKPLRLRNFSFRRAGGQTNRNYIVSSRGRKFFVRLPWEEVLDRRTEGENALALSRNKKVHRILPKYHVYVLSKKNILNPNDKNAYNVPDGTMVTEFIEGREFTFQDFQKASYRKLLAKMFHAFHVSGIRFPNSYNVFEDEVRKYRKKIPHSWWKRFFDEKTKAHLLSLEREAEKILPSLKKGIATHNDFLFQNFLFGKNRRIYLLDFEYAGLSKKGGILYDFGFLFADNLFRNPPVTKKLFEEFLDVVDQTYKKRLNRQHIYWAAVAALLVQVWWGMLRYFSVSPKERPYFKQYVQKRVEGVFKLCKEFKEKESRV